MIKNIIFDLGGVFINLDFNKTADAFTELGVKDFNQYFTQVHSNSLFKQLETGAVTDTGFYDAVRVAASITASNQQIDAAWNAMLLDFPPERITRLQRLSANYRLFLFSNTNAIHHAFFLQQFREQFGFEFDSLFEKAYYSHLIGRRKPDVSAFEFVISDSNLEAAHTLFIDDTLPNVEAATKAGLLAAHILPGSDVISLLDELL